MLRSLCFLSFAVFTGVIFCFGFSKAMGQIPVIQWKKCLGGSSGDEARSIQQTRDSGYIVAGFTGSDDSEVTGYHGGTDYWLVKLSASGSIQWQKCLGGTNSDIGWSVEQTKDNGYIATGYSNSNDGDVSGNHGYWDYWVVKLDDTGAIQWQKSFGGDTFDIPKCIQQTSDSGYIVTGASSSTGGDVTGNHGTADCWILKLSSAGDVQWKKCYGGSGGDGGVCIKQTSDGGYIVASSSNSTDGDVTGNHGGYDVWIMKLTPSGAITWEKSYGGSGTDYAEWIQQTPDGYIVACSSNSTDGDVTGNHGDFDYWVIKLSPSGAILWQKSFGGSNAEFASSVQPTLDGGYVVAGTTFSNDAQVTGFKGMSDAWIAKLSFIGTLQWQKSFGGTSYDGAESMQQTADSGYIIAGYTSSDDSDVTGYKGGTDYWIVKLGDPLKKDTTITDTTRTGISLVNNKQILLLPNPTTGDISVTGAGIVHIKVYDGPGRLVKEARNTNHISISELPDGVYFVKLFDGQGLLLKQDKIIKR